MKPLLRILILETDANMRLQFAENIRETALRFGRHDVDIDVIECGDVACVLDSVRDDGDIQAVILSWSEMPDASSQSRAALIDEIKSIRLELPVYVVADDSLDPAYRALMIALPSQSELAERIHAHAGTAPDPMAIWQALETLSELRATRCADLLTDLAREARVDAPYAPDATQSGKRALGGAVLAMTTRLDGGAAAEAQYATADNMTLQLSALACLMRAGKAGTALDAFERQWRHDRLVMDKWFGLQITEAGPEDAARRAQALVQHPAFDLKNPNRFRAVFGALAANHVGFHRADGAAYDLLADWLIRLDDLNPQTTARMCGAFQTWTRYDADRQALMRAALERIAAKPDLSRDTGEMVSRLLS